MSNDHIQLFLKYYFSSTLKHTHVIFLLALHAELANFKKMKVFICLSTVMTWARSKPLDPVSLYTGSFSFTAVTKQVYKQEQRK